MRFRHFIVFCVAFGAATYCAAQVPRIERIHAEDGLAQTQINDILQDRLGFLWIATIEGLYRYDGREFVVWRRSREQATLPSNDVRVLLEDRDGSLWVGGYAGGIARFDVRTQGFELFSPDPKSSTALQHGNISVLSRDPRGFFWVGTYGGGLDQFDPHSKVFTRVLHHGDESDRIHDLLQQGEDLWIATEGGLIRRSNDGKFVVYRNDPKDPGSLSGTRVDALAAHPDGKIWVGTESGLNLFDPETGRSRLFLHPPEDPASVRTNRVLSLHARYDDPDGPALWIGSDGGLSRFDPVSESFVEQYRHHWILSDTLSDDRVLSLHFDRSGLLWIGTRVGLNQLNPAAARFRRIAPDPLNPDEGLSGHRIRSLLETQDGDLWVGTRQGLNRLDRQTGEFSHWGHDPEDPESLGNNDVTALFEDRAGSLWLGTPWSGLSRFDRESGTFRHWRHDPDDPSSLISDDVLVVTEDMQDRLWIGTYAGLSRFDRSAETFRNYLHDPEDPQSLASDQIFALHPAADGDLWIGTEMAGLDRFDAETETFEHYPFHSVEQGSEGSGVSAMRIHAMLDGADGALWIATWGGGLDRLDPRDGSFRRYTEEDGLPSDSLYGLVQDDAGYFWISTTKGLSRFHPTTETFRNFTVDDGLPSDEFSLHAYGRGREEVFFGGINGLVIFRPELIDDASHAPPIVLTSVRIRERPAELPISAPFLNELELSHGEDLISLRFAALDFTAPQRNRYRFTLHEVGTEEDWLDLGTSNEWTISDPVPGEYELRVQGTNHQGVWSPHELRLRLQVLPAWWETWWLRIFVLSSLVGGIVLFFERRARKLRREIYARRRSEEERERLIDELEAKNAELERFNYTVSHDLKSPLVTIRGFLGHLERDAVDGKLDRFRSDMSRIEGAVDTMQKLLDELLRLSRAGHQSEPFKTVPLSRLMVDAVEAVHGRLSGVEVSIASELPDVEGDYIRLLEVFQNLIDNAAKFMGDQKSPRIEIGFRPGAVDEATLFVRDNGLGIDPRYHEKVFGLFDRLETGVEGTGVGLALVKRIVEMHDGKIWVESGGVGCGSTFVVKLPVLSTRA